MDFSLIYHHSLFSQNVFGCYMSVRLVCRGCLAPSIHPSKNQCVAKHGGMVEIYQRSKFCFIAKGQPPLAMTIEDHGKHFVTIMSVHLICCAAVLQKISVFSNNQYVSNVKVSCQSHSLKTFGYKHQKSWRHILSSYLDFAK